MTNLLTGSVQNEDRQVVNENADPKEYRGQQDPRDLRIENDDDEDRRS